MCTEMGDRMQDTIDEQQEQIEQLTSTLEERDAKLEQLEKILIAAGSFGRGWESKGVKAGCHMVMSLTQTIIIVQVQLVSMLVNTVQQQVVSQAGLSKQWPMVMLTVTRHLEHILSTLEKILHIMLTRMVQQD